MKKLILFLAFIAMYAVLSSCSSSNGEEIAGTVASMEMNDSRTLDALKSYNETLLNSCQQTRGWGKRLLVASADIKGAVKGIDAGKTLASVVGAASGGTGAAVVVVGSGLIVGAAYSYLAYKGSTICSYPAQISDFLNYSRKLVSGRIVVEGKTDSATSRTDEAIFNPENEAYNNIELPQEFGYLRTLGADHNAILLAANVDGELPTEESVTSANLGQVEVDEEEQDKFEQAINSPMFNDSFFAAIDEFNDEKGFETLGCSDRVKQALQSYLDLFQTYPENVDELVKIANGYIKIIEENNEFTKDEKELIYSAIMVSVYSPQLWDNFK